MRRFKWIRSRRNVLVAVLTAAGIVLVASYGFNYLQAYFSDKHVATGVTTKQSVTTPVSAQQKAYGLPVRLAIPKLHVDTAILYMGLTAGGDMEVPADLQNVGWYKFGPHPGDPGSAVIAGHLEGYKDKGVFIGLATLKRGDIVTVMDDAGISRRFAVRESRTYSQHERPPEVFQAADQAAHLNLITCTGIWHESEKRYSQRLVVFTDKIE